MLRSPTVVKVGGNEIDDPDWVGSLCTSIAQMQEPVIVVHGGGREVTSLQRSLDSEPVWHEGLRVTTPGALKAASMVLSGLVNKRLVSRLIGAGVTAVGISGEDASMLMAVPAKHGRLGHTGSIAAVDPRLLTTLLDAGLAPVVSPLSRGTDGGALNVNADEVAAAVAVATGARRFLLISNVPGFLRGGEVVPEIFGGDVEAVIDSGEAKGGMAPKLRAAYTAAAGGVGEVRIGELAMLQGKQMGTRVVDEASLVSTWAH